MRKHTRANLRLAKKLGVELPTAAPSRLDTRRVTDGHEDFVFGSGRAARFVNRRNDGRWTVKLGSRPMGDFVSFDEAEGFAIWLGRKANRRAARGFAPKVKTVGSPTPEGSLRELLESVNGGAVTVK